MKEKPRIVVEFKDGEPSLIRAEGGLERVLTEADLSSTIECHGEEHLLGVVAVFACHARKFRPGVIFKTALECPKDHPLMAGRLGYKFCPKGGERLQDDEQSKNAEPSCDSSDHTSMRMELGFDFCSKCGLPLQELL